MFTVLGRSPEAELEHEQTEDGDGTVSVRRVLRDVNINILWNKQYVLFWISSALAYTNSFISSRLSSSSLPSCR